MCATAILRSAASSVDAADVAGAALRADFAAVLSPAFAFGLFEFTQYPVAYAFGCAAFAPDLFPCVFTQWPFFALSHTHQKNVSLRLVAGFLNRAIVPTLLGRTRPRHKTPT